MRDKFNEQLEQLNVELIKMGALCEEGISASTKALLEQDDALRETAIAAERETDQKERDIENLCMRMLLQQQPVAGDLRAISAALKMISDMERIGDQAADIAEITKYVANSPVVSRVPIADMARSVIGMVTDSIDSFVRKNLDLAQKVVRTDDEIDDLFLAVMNGTVDLHDTSRLTCLMLGSSDLTLRDGGKTLIRLESGSPVNVGFKTEERNLASAKKIFVTFYRTKSCQLPATVTFGRRIRSVTARNRDGAELAKIPHTEYSFQNLWRKGHLISYYEVVLGE